MNRFLRSATLLAAPLLLAGCTITLGPGPTNPFTGAPTVGVTEDRGGGTPTPVATDVTIAADEPNYFVVTVPDERDQPLLYLEAYDGAGAPLTVEVFESATGDALFRSSSPVTYTDATATTAAVGAELDSQQVVRRGCEGPCVIVPNDANTVYLRVSTRSATTVDYNLFVYDADYDEDSEPANNSCSTTTVALSGGDSYFGAIETFGDRDCIEISGADNDVDINWVGQSQLIEIDVIVTDADGDTEVETLSATGTSSTTISMAAPIVRVQIVGPADAAGPPVGSSYSVFF